MTQLRSSNIPDLSQIVLVLPSCKTNWTLTNNICRSKSQDGDFPLARKQEVKQRWIQELKNRSTAMFINWRILKRPDQPGIDLGLGLGLGFRRIAD